MKVTPSWSGLQSRKAQSKLHSHHKPFAPALGMALAHPRYLRPCQISQYKAGIRKTANTCPSLMTRPQWQ